jgi:O-antigen ligase
VVARLKGFIFAGIVLIALFPLIGDYTNLFFPLGRDILFRIVVEVLFFAYLVLIILEKRYFPSLSPLLISLFLFLLASGIATLFSLQPQFSLWGNIFRGHGFFSQIHYFVFFVILVAVVRTWEEWNKIILAAIFASVAVSAIAFAEFFNGKAAQSMLNNPNFLGAYLLLVLFITLEMVLYYWHDKEKQNLTIFLMVAVALQFLTIIFTRSRGAYLGLAVGFFSVLFWYFNDKISFWAWLKASRSRFFLTLMFLVLLIGSSLYYFIRVPRPQIQRFLGPNPLPSEMSSGLIDWTRIEAYRTGILALLNRPLVGFGPENFVVVYDRYFRGILTQMQYFDKAHNIVIEIAATMGVLGLLTYAGVWAIVFWLLVKKWPTKEKLPSFRGPLFITFVVYLCQDFFNIDTTTSLIYVYLWWGFLNFLASPKIKSEELVEKRISSLRLGTGLVAVIVMAPLLVFSIKEFNLKALEANLFRNRAEEALAKRDFESSFKWFEKGLRVDDPAVNPHLRFEYGKAAVKFAKRQSYLGKPQPEEVLKRAIELQEENGKNEWPYFTRNYLLAGELANFLGVNHSEYLDRANDYLAKALDLSPRRWEAYLLGAKTDLIRRDFSAAESKIKKVLAANYKYAEAWFQYGLLKVYQGQPTQAKQYFLKAISMSRAVYSLENRNELVLAYEAVQDWQNLIPVLEGLVREQPWVFEYKLKLVRIYQKAGREEEAKNLFRFISRSVPPGYWPAVQELRQELE